VFVPLNNPSLAEIYQQVALVNKVSTQICLLLEELSKKPYAEKLSAVTSVGHLYLTAARSWDEQSKGGIISINERIDANKEVLVIAYHPHTIRKSQVWHQGSLKEIVDYIDLYVMRLLSENYGSIEV
jgi:hypothetical protein